MTPIRKRLATFVATLFAVSMTATPLPVEARGGKAKTSIGHAGGGQGAGRNRGGANRPATADRRPARQPPRAGAGGNRVSGDRNRGGGNRNRGGHNNVVAGNTVVVNRNVDRGYHHGHYDHDWDDDWGHHDGFWDDVGEAALTTAAVVGTAAVIGEILEDEPDNCQQSVHHGETYLYCNGVWYQPAMSGGDTQYVVVNNPG